MKVHRDKVNKGKGKKEKVSKSEKKEKDQRRVRKKREEHKGKDGSSKKRKSGHQHESAAFWDSLHGDEVDPADQVPSGEPWEPLAQHWASMSKVASESEVPVYTAPEEALKYLPERFLAFQKASWPSEPHEKFAALAAVAKIVTQFEQSDFTHFLRSLQLILVGRRRSEEAIDVDEAGPPLRRKAFFPEPKQQPAPKPRIPPPPPPPAPPQPLQPPPPPGPKHVPKEQAQSSQEDPKAVPKLQPVAPSSSSDTETETREKAGAKETEETREAAAARKKADAAALDVVYDLCQAQNERPCHTEEALHLENFRLFTKEVFAAATQTKHWEEAWRGTSFPENLRPEASQAFLQNILDCATGKDPAAAALAIAALSRAHLIKRQSVEEFFLAKVETDNPTMWQILSLLLFHWFPQNKTAGWGWSRVGWSWSEWWKLVERLLNKAQKTSRESAFKALKGALVRMQEQKGCRHIFLKAPFDELRRQMLIDRLSLLAPEIDVSTEAKAKEALAPLKFWRS